MSRHLASIQKVGTVSAIEGADRIELAHVLGWQCVVGKGTFKEGDIGVYFEIDSFLPMRDEFEFLRSSSYRNSELLGEGFRMKTQKFRGEISQGLLMPITNFPELEGINNEFDSAVGMDVTELLGVRKWEIPESTTTGGTVIGQLPYDVPHTDETRIQTAPELIGEFEGLDYYITTKMDGSSHSISIDRNGIHVTGHNYEYKDDGKSGFYEFVKKKGIIERIRKVYEIGDYKSLTIQGEFCGEGIQKNRLRLKEPEWYVFTVRIDGQRVGLNRMVDICSMASLEMVPLEETGKNLPAKYPDIDALLKRADGEYPNGGKKEGIVIRPTEPVFSKTISASLSMKVINNKYLLKNEL